MWKRLVPVLHLPDEPRWLTNAGRVGDRKAVDAVVAAALATLTVAEADQRLAAADVPAGPVLTMDQTLAHPAVSLIEASHAALGPVTLPGPAFTTLTTRAEHDAPPLLGQQRDAVLEALGYAPDAIADLAQRGAFGG